MAVEVAVADMVEVVDTAEVVAVDVVVSLVCTPLTRSITDGSNKDVVKGFTSSNSAPLGNRSRW